MNDGTKLLRSTLFVQLSVSGNDNKIVLLLDVTYVGKISTNSRFSSSPIIQLVFDLNLLGLVLGIILFGLPSNLRLAFFIFRPHVATLSACNATFPKLRTPLVLPSVTCNVYDYNHCVAVAGMPVAILNRETARRTRPPHLKAAG
jgi:hypothetical protein